MDDEQQDSPQGVPHAPFTPEDGAYAAIVSEYLGLQRAGADPLGAALITAAHLTLMGMAGAAGQQQPGT
ncbi:MAG TPA: hypothetical protein VKV80_20065 [Streptosporangiaceae bacterium]|nr:hypothetical protein [Streptosporangiaceae bacterium]